MSIMDMSPNTANRINPRINEFFHFELNFAKLSDLMPCINKLHLFNAELGLADSLLFL